MPGTNRREATLRPFEALLRTHSRKGAQVRGWVRSEKGEALVGALASLYGADAENGGTLLESSRSDDRGFFQLALESAPGPVRLTLEHPLQVGLQDFLELADGSRVERRYTLEPARARLEGRVVDPAGLPVAGVRVQVSRIRSFTPARTESAYVAPIETGGDGRFLLEGLPVGPISLSFLARGFFVSGTQATLQPGDNPPLAHQLEPGLERFLRVVDSRGQPVFPATLLTAEPTPFTAGEEGRIDFLLRPGTDGTTAELSAPGYLARIIEVRAASNGTREVLEPGPRFEGVVLSAAGRPVPGARVTVSGANSFYEGSVRSGPDGRFELGLSRPPVTSLYVTHPAYVETRVRLEGSGPPFVEVRLERPETGLYGWVLSSSGRPLEFFSIYLNDQRGRGFSRHFRDSRGYFEILDLPAGTYRLQVTSEDRAHLQQTLRREGLVLPRGQVLGELWLQFPAPTDR